MNSMDDVYDFIEDEWEYLMYPLDIISSIDTVPISGSVIYKLGHRSYKVYKHKNMNAIMFYIRHKQIQKYKNISTKKKEKDRLISNFIVIYKQVIKLPISVSVERNALVIKIFWTDER